MWTELASLDDIPPGSGREFTIGDRIVALFQTLEGHWHACDGICPHAGGPLGEGTLQGTVVTCPWHGWQFDVSTGRHCLTPQIRVQQFPVRIDGSVISVELP